MLSLGEQQRLAFARVLYNRPSVVVLDESTSALDAETEAMMYSLLEKVRRVYCVSGFVFILYCIALYSMLFYSILFYSIVFYSMYFIHWR